MKIGNDIVQPEDQIDECYRCHQPLEVGDEYWSESSTEHVYCTKTCLENDLDDAEQESRREADRDASEQELYERQAASDRRWGPGKIYG